MYHAMNPVLSLIVAVYNRPQELRFLFAALARQTFTKFEVIIADDGSGKAVADVVNEAKRAMPFRIIHLWHADKGWRKNVMLNYAINEAKTEYIVFMDGDCLPGKNFLLDHFTHREIRKVLLGRRVEHGKRWAGNMTLAKVQNGEFERYDLMDLVDAVRGRSTRLEHGIRLTHPMLRRLVEKSDSMLGCNFSTYKEHLVAVNGFDEDYDGPGLGEDSDLFYRFNLAGIQGISLRNLAIQYHLWHPLTRISEKNRFLFETKRNRKDPRCRNGLVKLRT